MRASSMRSSLLLLLTAAIWGAAFVAQSVGMDYVGPFTFSCVRCLLGGAVLIPCIALLDHIRTKRAESRRVGRKETERKGTGLEETEPEETGRKETEPEEAGSGEIRKRATLIGGICCGIALFAASNLQQIGIQYTTAGKAGFITAMYVVLVPVLGIFIGKRAGWRVWISVALAVAGLYLLCITQGFSIGTGDILVMLCALIFAVHILVIDHFSPLADGVRMACIQFFVCGILSGIPMLIFEHPVPGDILQAWLPIGYAGVLSCGVAYTLQIIGQRDLDPTVASLILSLESVFSVLSGWLILRQALSAREGTGCLLMFAAIILAQLPGRRHRR